MQLLEQAIVGATQQLVENVEVSLVVVLVHDARLFQKVVQDVAAVRNALPAIKVVIDILSSFYRLPIEVDVHVLAEAR